MNEELPFCIMVHCPSWAIDAVDWGCAFDADAFARGEKVDCPYVGRRITEAFEKAKGVFNAMLAEARAWTAADFGGDEAFAKLAIIMVRLVHYTGMRAIAALGVVPYLWASLHKPGVKSKIEAQWSSVEDNSKFDRVTRRVMECPLLRLDFEAVGEDGSNISFRLGEVCRGVSLVGCDDVKAERAQAVATHVDDAAPAGTLIHTAVAAGLPQHIEDWRNIPDIVGVSLDLVWKRWKTVLEVDPYRSKRDKPARINPEKFLRLLYLLEDGTDDVHGAVK